MLCNQHCFCRYVSYLVWSSLVKTVTQPAPPYGVVYHMRGSLINLSESTGKCDVVKSSQLSAMMNMVNSEKLEIWSFFYEYSHVWLHACWTSQTWQTMQRVTQCVCVFTVFTHLKQHCTHLSSSCQSTQLCLLSKVWHENTTEVGREKHDGVRP